MEWLLLAGQMIVSESHFGFKRSVRVIIGFMTVWHKIGSSGNLRFYFYMSQQPIEYPPDDHLSLCNSSADPTEDDGTALTQHSQMSSGDFSSNFARLMWK